MASIVYSDVRKGMFIVGDEGQLYCVVDRELKTPGNLRSKLTLKMKNLKTGLVLERRVHPEDKVEQAYLDKRAMEYLYRDNDGFVFMDSESFDQVTLRPDLVEEMMPYLKEGNKAQVVFHGENPLSLELPATVDLLVTATDPGLKGATAAAQTKPATLETGLTINVPPFITQGEKVQVDTRTGEYLGRVKEG